MRYEIIMLCAAGAALAPAIGWEIIKRWPRSPAKRAAFLRQAFIAKRRAEGLPMDKIMSEMVRFEGLARIRRRASELVRANPAEAAEEAIRAVAKEELLIMAAAGNKDDTKALAKAIDTLPLRDLLDGDAYRAWLAHLVSITPEPAPASHSDHEDAISAYSGRF